MPRDIIVRAGRSDTFFSAEPARPEPVGSKKSLCLQHPHSPRVDSDLQQVSGAFVKGLPRHVQGRDRPHLEATLLSCRLCHRQASIFSARPRVPRNSRRAV
jgi:hypothetical protein